MIDTVIMTIYGDTGRAWRANNTPDTHTGADHYTGHIGNMRIVENLDGVTITGSIAKYTKGENVTAMTRAELAAGLHKLEQAADIDLHNATLRRVDCGVCLITEKPTVNYLRNFEAVQRYQKTVTFNSSGFLQTVLFFTNTGATAFCIYDKTAEMQAKKETVPELFVNENVIRLEYRLLKRQGIRQYLGNGKDVTPYELADYQTWETLKKLFIEFYRNIEKSDRTVFVDGGRQTTPAELTAILAEYYRQETPEQYKALIQALTACGGLSGKSVERIRAIEKKNNSDFRFSDTSDLINELDEKIKAF